MPLTPREIEELIKIGKTKEAIGQLLELLEQKDKDLHSQVVHLSSQFHRYQEHHHLGTITREDYQIGFNRITDALLSYTTALEDLDKVDFAEARKREAKEELYETIKIMHDHVKAFVEKIPEKKKDLKKLLESDQKLLKETGEKIDVATDEKKKKKLQKEVEERKKDIKQHIIKLRKINEIQLLNAREQLTRIDFVNRTREIENIEITSGSTDYRFVDAPAGYGKTEFMKEIKRRYDERGNYLTAYIQINNQDDIATIFKKFAKELMFNSIPSNITEKNFGSTLLKKLFEKYEKELHRKGFLLLVDFNGKPSEYFFFLRDRIVPGIWGAIKNIPYFESDPGHFKVIYAGRYLSKHSSGSSKKPLSLSDFDFDAIRSTVRASWIRGNSFIDAASAHILYLTGGHPLCISKALCMGIFQPSHLISNSHEVYPFIHLVAESIEFELLSEKDWFFPVLKACAVFRKINSRILEKIKDQLFGHFDLEAIQIDHALRYSHIWKTIRFSDVLRDGIARKVLTINMRQSDPEKYLMYCEFARESCFEQIKVTGGLPTRYWFIEFLFQSLQIHALEINDAAKRRYIRNQFYGESGDFAKGLEEYKKTIKEGQLNGNLDKLIEDIDYDKEFQFTVNYYLRENDEEYNSDPIEQLKRKVNEELKQK